MEDAVCRTCLSSSDLQPIFMNSEDHDRYSSAVFFTTGVKIAPNDGLPQSMCIQCINFLTDSLKFRKKCRDTEEYLLNIKNYSQSPALDTEKVICESKNSDSEATEERVNLKCNMEKTEYLDVAPDDTDDDDKPLKVWFDENSDTSTTQDIVFIEKECIRKEEPKIIIPTVRKRISCQYCSKNISVRCLSRHVAQKHPDADDRWTKCALCDKIVVKEKMAWHRKTKHSDGKSFRCGVKQFAECHICHKKMLKASIKMHVAIKHEGKGPVCEHCGRRFANNLRLSEHRRARHGHDKFKCGQCDYQSASRDTLQNHERRHRGERPFVCETCGTGFHSLHYLHQHRQSHRTEKAIKCDLCPAIFKANNSLHVHKMTCHSTTAFRCGLCARTFGCRTYAVRHVKHVHSLEQPASVLERVDRLELESEQ